MDNTPVQMHRATDGANALVEPWEVEMWRGYGFEPVDAKGEKQKTKTPKADKPAKVADAAQG